MTATYDLIASNVLSSPTSTLTFSSLPSTYRDLILVARYSGATTGSNGVGFRFNGDTGSNYFTNWLVGNGGTPSAFASSGSLFQTNWSLNVQSAFNFNSIIQIFDYSQTNKHKFVIYRQNVADSGGGDSTLVGGRWISQNAITSITFFSTNSVNFPVGSAFSLYGIVS